MLLVIFMKVYTPRIGKYVIALQYSGSFWFLLSLPNMRKAIMYFNVKLLKISIPSHQSSFSSSSSISSSLILWLLSLSDSLSLSLSQNRAVPHPPFLLLLALTLSQGRAVSLTLTGSCSVRLTLSQGRAVPHAILKENRETNRKTC